MGTEQARILIDNLKSTGCDYTVLFYLRNPAIISETSLGRDLQAFLRKHDLTLAHFEVHEKNKEFLWDFFQEIRKEFSRHGITAVNPRNYLVTMNKGGKAAIIDMYSKVDWPRPHQPYCIQTMGSTDVLFFTFQTWQDALIMQRDLFSMGGYKYKGHWVDIEQVYEHQWGEERVVSLMIDWEIMLSHYGGKKSVEDVEMIAEKFPAWLIQQLRIHKLISPENDIECVVKNKSRAKGKDFKVSKHFLFNIQAVTKKGHYQALSRVIEPYVERMKEFHHTKNLDHVSPEHLDLPVWGWDNRLLRGQNGIGTLFGRKKGEIDAPLPSVDYRLIIGAGGACKKENFSWKGEILDTQHKKALVALYRCGYTVPQLDYVTYMLDFVSSVKVLVFYHIFYHIFWRVTVLLSHFLESNCTFITFFGE
jgi:hypothetical protein